MTKSVKITPEEFQQIKAFLEEKSGIVVAENKTYLVENRLIDLLGKYNCDSFGALCSKAKLSSPDLAKEIVDLMTTNETLWFRDSRPFDIFSKVLLPEKILPALKKRTKSKIRIWSSACSTGQEPYSIAMLIAETMQKNSWLKPEMFELMATDISERCLRAAQKGSYDKVAINRGLTDTFREKYFASVGKLWEITDDIKQLVKFRQFNLQDDFSAFGKFDIIFCRNVAIYFSQDFKAGLYDRFADSLVKEGILFVGASESLGGYCDKFSIKNYENGFFYQVVK